MMSKVNTVPFNCIRNQGIGKYNPPLISSETSTDKLVSSNGLHKVKSLVFKQTQHLVNRLLCLTQCIILYWKLVYNTWVVKKCFNHVQMIHRFVGHWISAECVSVSVCLSLDVLNLLLEVLNQQPPVLDSSRLGLVKGKV